MGAILKWVGKTSITFRLNNTRFIIKYLEQHHCYCSYCSPSVFFIIVPVCSRSSFSFNTSKHVELFKQYGFCGWCVISLLVSFAPASRYRGSESACRGGAGGVSRRGRWSPLPVHRWRRPDQTHTGGTMERSSCVLSSFGWPWLTW